MPDTALYDTPRTQRSRSEPTARRLLMVTHDYPPTHHGTGKTAALAAAGLTAMGWRVMVLTAGDGPMSEVAAGHRAGGDDCCRSSANAVDGIEVVRSTSAGPEAARIARTFVPDVVLAFSGAQDGEVARRIRREFGTPYVLSIRGLDDPALHTGGPSRRVLARLARPWLGSILEDAAAVVVPSEDLAGMVRAVAPNQQVLVVPNSVERVPARERHERQTTAIRVLCAGLLTAQKDVATPIRAMAEVGMARRKAVLDVAGDGPERARLEALASRLGLGARVVFHGHMGREGLYALMQQADIFVLPSLCGGMSNALLEAMAHACPCVASDGTVTPGVFRHGVDGLVFKAGDASELSEIISTLADRPREALRLGEAARAAARRLTPRSVAILWHEVLMGVARRRQAA